MTLRLREEERSQREWNRRARDAVNGLIRRLTGVGSSAARPASPVDGQMYYDRTLKRPIWWNSEDAEWKDAAGTAA
jgi:hypothetical protein